MNVTLTLRQVMGFADYLKRVDADTRPTHAAIHFARVDEKHARAYVTDGFSAIVLELGASWRETAEHMISYQRDDIKLLISALKADKKRPDYEISFLDDHIAFGGSDRLIIKPTEMTAPDIGKILRDMRKPIERFVGAGKSLDFVMLGGIIGIMQKMSDLDSALQFDVRFVGDVAFITHSEEQSIFALQMATQPNREAVGGSFDVYEQNIKRILGRE